MRLDNKRLMVWWLETTVQLARFRCEDAKQSTSHLVK